MRVAARRPASPSRAFDVLYRKHAGDIYRYVLAMLRRQADAEDAVQTTFLNAYRALERGERPRDGGSWLRAIALNVCREHQRRASRRPAEVSLEDDPGDLVRDDDQTPPIGDVMRGLSHLPFNQRAALVMREFEGRPVAEIAAALDVSASAVETLLFRARRALREQLGETLTCAEAEQAISSQLDGALPRGERGPLRAHLRECSACASLARRLRAQRSAVRGLAAIPLPASPALSRLGGGAGAGVGVSATAGGSAAGSVPTSLAASVAAKFAAATLAGATALGVGYATLDHTRSGPATSRANASAAGGVTRTADAKLVGHGSGGADPARSRLLGTAGASGSASRSGRAGVGRSAGRAGRGHGSTAPLGGTRRIDARGAHQARSAATAVSAGAVAGSEAPAGNGYGRPKVHAPKPSATAHSNSGHRRGSNGALAGKAHANGNAGGSGSTQAAGGAGGSASVQATGKGGATGRGSSAGKGDAGTAGVGTTTTGRTGRANAKAQGTGGG